VNDTEPKDGTGTCLVCGEDVPTHDLVGHLRVMHPDQYEPVQTWADGSPVVTDDTLTPDDFTQPPTA
jgi:hypothetical protein